MSGRSQFLRREPTRGSGHIAGFARTHVGALRRVRRRVPVVLSTAMALVAAIAPASGADDAVAFSFADPAGDVVLAPDVTTVEGSWSTSGPLVLDVALGNIAEPDVFGEFQYVIVGFDTDFDGMQDFNLLSTGFGGTRICEREPEGDPNIFVCQFNSDRVIGELVESVLHIELIDTALLGTAFQFSVLGRNEDPNETDFAGRWGVALVDDQAPEIQVAFDPITLWPTQPDGNDVFEYRFLVRAVDNIDPDPELECDPPSGSLLPIGETVVTCTATDNAGNTSAPTSFTVIVLSPVEVLATLEATVSNSDAAPARGLTRMLAQARRQLEAERSTQACHLLKAFIATVTALGEHEQSGVPPWWASSVGYIADQILRCDK